MDAVGSPAPQVAKQPPPSPQAVPPIGSSVTVPPSSMSFIQTKAAPAPPPWMAVPAAVAVPSMPLLPATSMQNPRPVVLPPVSTAVVATPPPPKAVAVPAVQTVPVPVPVPVQ
eukprot:4813631-Amphidinium_carterae.1